MKRATFLVLAILCAGLLAVAPGCGDDDDGGGNGGGDDECGLQDCGVGSCEPGFHLEIGDATFEFHAEDVECVMETTGCAHFCFEFEASVEEPAFGELDFSVCYDEEEGGDLFGMVWAENEDGEYGDYAEFDCFFFEKQPDIFSGNFAGQCGPEFTGCFDLIFCEENHV